MSIAYVSIASEVLRLVFAPRATKETLSKPARRGWLSRL